MSEPTIKTIGLNEAALLFTEDDLELIVPGLDDYETIPPHVEEACAAGMLLRSDKPEFVELRAKLYQVFKASCKEELENG